MTGRVHNLRSNIGGGRFRSHLVPVIEPSAHLQLEQAATIPPGAVGGLYGSGCLYCSNMRSVSATSF